VVDLGDRVVLRPMPHDAVEALVGKYRGKGPGTEQARARARADDATIERRKRR
jgi:hypothetical protein